MTPRWTRLTYHPTQWQYWTSQCRFNISHSGRRSGKTEIAKRRLIKRALNFTAAPDGRFIFSAPVNQQARQIFWEDAKAMVPQCLLRKPYNRAISESLMTIYLVTGTRIEVIGMDKAERIEGSPVDGIVLDEYGNMKSTVWGQNVRPALSTLGRPGWADLIGVPEGRNHYFELTDKVKKGNIENWAVHAWSTKDINPDEYDTSKGDMDELTHLQEYDGLFVSFEGLAYYAFSDLNYPPDGERIRYNPNLDLVACFDFNRNPGVCTLVQEQEPPDWLIKRNGEDKGLVTTVVGEAWIDKNSNTEKICDVLIRDWSKHSQRLWLYGDATGGNKTSSSVEGSDWDIIDNKLRPIFGKRLCEAFPRGNPPVRKRINSVNSRLKAANGYIGTILSEETAPKLIRDFEGVTVKPDGDLDKGADEILTHISDAFGYYTAEEHPVGGEEKLYVKRF